MIVKAPAAKLGVMPAETARLADKGPAQSNTPAPEVAVPTLAWVMVFVPAVQAPKLIAATLEMVCDDIDQPPEVRATATRA